MIGRWWRAWRHWRRSRPFWGGLLIVLGAAEILLTERLPLRVILHLGVQGIAGYLLPVVMILCGLLLWFNPSQRVFYSILAVLLSLGTWVTSNLGGFIIGLVLGVVGGSLAFAWTPRPAPAATPTPTEGARSPRA
jgi:Family of unknown function (DUF6114)